MSSYPRSVLGGSLLFFLELHGNFPPVRCGCRGAGVVGLLGALLAVEARGCPLSKFRDGVRLTNFCPVDCWLLAGSTGAFWSG